MAHAVLKEKLQELYFIENNLVDALEKLAENAGDAELKQSLLDHREETREQVKRVQEAFTALGETAQAKECKHVAVMLEEVDQKVSETSGEDRDVVIKLAALETEHLEMGWYEGICALAEKLGEDEVKDALEPTMAEEEAAAKKVLTAIKK